MKIIIFCNKYNLLMEQNMIISDKNVEEVYDNISESFDNSRNKVWESVKEFLDTQEEYSIGLEIGCGNGKNMLYRVILFA